MVSRWGFRVTAMRTKIGIFFSSLFLGGVVSLAAVPEASAGSGSCAKCTSSGSYCVSSASGFTFCGFENGKCKVRGSACGLTIGS